MKLAENYLLSVPLWLTNYWIQSVISLANQISSLREKILSFIKAITKYRREPATHVLVVLISPEERNKKPYALAVQCIAYKSIEDIEV